MTYDLGRICPKLRGAYSNSATYDFLDVVSLNGSSYICKADGTKNKVPTNTSYWMIFAQSGESAHITQADIENIVNQLLQENVVVDENYGTFKQDTQNAINGIGNGTLTIKRNGVTVGTFSANQNTAKEINIAVPTKLSDLSDYNSVHTGNVEIREVEENDFEKVEPGTTYLFKEALNSLAIQNLVPLEEVGNKAPAHIVFTVGDSFTPTLPSGCFVHDCAGIAGKEYYLTAGARYEFEVFGNMIIIREYKAWG